MFPRKGVQVIKVVPLQMVPTLDETPVKDCHTYFADTTRSDTNITTPILQYLLLPYLRFPTGAWQLVCH